jgi:HK97 family phage major capsid protein
MHREQVERRRRDIAKEMSAIASRTAISPEARTQFDKLDMEGKELKQWLDDPSNGTTRPPNGDIEGQAQRSSTPETWIDTKSGREVRLLGHNESVRESRNLGEPEVGLGRICRAMVLGPKSTAESRVLSENISSTGSFTLPDPLAAQIIDKLRSEMVCRRAGARTIVMDAQQLRIARLKTDPVANWRAENQSIGTTDPVLEGIILLAKSLAFCVPVSRELLMDSQNIDQILPGVFSSVIAHEFDRVALVGDGNASPTDNEPTGIKNTSNVGSVTLGTFPASYDQIVDAYTTIKEGNAADPTAVICSPRTAGRYAKLKDSQQRPLFKPELIADIPWYPTTSIANNYSGDASPVGGESIAIVGDFTQLLLAIRMDVTVDVLKERFSDNYQYGFLCGFRADVAVTHSESFCVVKGIL